MCLELLKENWRVFNRMVPTWTSRGNSARMTEPPSPSLWVKGVNVEVNRELQASAGLILLMGLAIVVLLYVSLRRVSDVLIVMFALGSALLWMQGMIGHFSSLTSMFGLSLIARSQFSNLLPHSRACFSIDDSLHALHRYKEEPSRTSKLLKHLQRSPCLGLDGPSC